MQVVDLLVAVAEAQIDIKCAELEMAAAPERHKLLAEGWEGEEESRQQAAAELRMLEAQLAAVRRGLAVCEGGGMFWGSSGSMHGSRQLTLHFYQGN